MLNGSPQRNLLPQDPNRPPMCRIPSRLLYRVDLVVDVVRGI